MKIAIVHEWLADYAGSERVLEQMLICLPSSDLFAVVDFVPAEKRGFLQGRTVRTSFVQRFPWARTKFRSYLPFMPLAIEQFDLSPYDVVISSSHAVAKGVITGPDQVHLCMCYSPIRYAWDLQHQYLSESGIEWGAKGVLARWILHRMRLWDVRTANGVDEFLAISRFIGRRIWKTYRRESVVVYPPVDTDAFQMRQDKEDFYLIASRLVPYKRMDLIVEAFAKMPGRRLVVIGDGPDDAKVRARLAPNITMLGYQPFASLRDHMQRARAFVFAAVEDFGIAPLEAQACGTPVIAYAKGGALETIVSEGSEPTGLFFGEQTVASIIDAVERFEARSQAFSATACRANAMRFSIAAFQARFRETVAEAISRSHLATSSGKLPFLEDEIDGRRQ